MRCCAVAAFWMRQWSDSNICIPVWQALLQMLESKDHWQNMGSSGVMDLAFALRLRGRGGANVKSTPLWRPEMAMARSRLICWLLAAALGMLTAAAAQAHPDVWISSTSELLYAPDGSITAVRHAWTFDDLFTTGALQEIDGKAKDVYSREELAPLARTNAESLKEFGYFNFARADGKKVKFDEPVDYFMEYAHSRLTLHFTLPLKEPAKPKELVLEVFDPTSFADFKFDGSDPVRLVGAPPSCKLDLQRRPMDRAAGAKPAGEHPAEGDHDDAGAMFANRITVACP